MQTRSNLFNGIKTVEKLLKLSLTSMLGKTNGKLKLKSSLTFCTRGSGEGKTISPSNDLCNSTGMRTCQCKLAVNTCNFNYRMN